MKPGSGEDDGGGHAGRICLGDRLRILAASPYNLGSSIAGGQPCSVLPYSTWLREGYVCAERLCVLSEER